ncbi:MAG TPA: DUF6186 family protein [Acidimicrobiales bacterium]|nr:DUF6186 family protein [Acidimicrobiales bacterium]
MTRTIALALWGVLAGLVVLCELLSLATRRRLAGFLAAASFLSTAPASRLVLLLGWMWLGWHLFAR